MNGQSKFGLSLTLLLALLTTFGVFTGCEEEKDTWRSEYPETLELRNMTIYVVDHKGNPVADARVCSSIRYELRSGMYTHEVDEYTDVNGYCKIQVPVTRDEFSMDVYGAISNEYFPSVRYQTHPLRCELPPPTLANWRFLILDCQIEAPLANASVWASKGRYKYSVQTDSLGYAEISIPRAIESFVISHSTLVPEYKNRLSNMKKGELNIIELNRPASFDDKRRYFILAEVKVEAYMSGELISGAEITLENKDQKPIPGRYVTNERGIAEIPVPFVSKVSLSVKAAGYESQVVRYNTPSDPWNTTYCGMRIVLKKSK